MPTEMIAKNEDQTSSDLAILVEKLVDYISLKIPEFSPQEHLDCSFSSLGLDSVSHVELSTIIGDHLQVTVDPALAFDYPTVNALVEHLQKNFSDN